MVDIGSDDLNRFFSLLEDWNKVLHGTNVPDLDEAFNDTDLDSGPQP
jgi:hypothetical protein